MNPNGQYPTLADVRKMLPNTVLLSIDPATKSPIHGKKWQQITFEQSQKEGHQRLLEQAESVGVLLGPPSNHLVVLDCDSLPFFDLMAVLCPFLKDTFTTRGRRGGGYWLWLIGEYPARIHEFTVEEGHPLGAGLSADPKTGLIHIGEFRCGRGQAIVCGRHQCGIKYTWPNPHPPVFGRFTDFTWPSELALPWVSKKKKKQQTRPDRPGYTGGGGGVSSSSSDNPDTELLQRAKVILTIPKLWQHFGYPPLNGDGDQLVSSPFREDSHPSFSIYDNGNRAKDHATGENIDSYDFFQKATGTNSRSAYRPFITQASLGAELRSRRSRNDPRPTIMHPGHNRYVGEFAAELSRILKPHDFYRFHGRLVQVREVTEKARNGKEYKVKKLIEISPLMFATMIEDYCRPIIKEGAYSIPLEAVQRTLVYPKFLDSFPEIKLWSAARLAVRTSDGIALSEPGYNPKARVYTSPDAPVIDETMSVEQAVEKWRGLLAEFCFPKSGTTEQEEPDERKREPERERAIAVTLAAALTPFCLYLLPEKAKRPGFAACANAEGAGKTLLLSIGMVAKLGYVPVGAAPNQEDEMRKVLDGAVHFGVPILFFDNLKGHLSSGQLEGFITAAKRQYRLLGSTNHYEAENVSTVYLTANFATYSSDLRRRLLAVELILEQARAEERIIKNYLNEERLIGMRPELLSIFWTLVRDWDRKKQPAGRVLLPSFEEWSKIIGGIIENAGFASPCQLVSMKTGGDTYTRDMEILVQEMNPQGEYRFTDLIVLANDHHLFSRLIPATGGMDRKQSTRLGIMFRRFVDRIFNSRYRFCLHEGTQVTERYYVEDLKPNEPF